MGSRSLGATNAAVLQLWTQQRSSGGTDVVKAAAASIAALGVDYERGIAALNEIRITDPAWRLVMDESLARALLAHGRCVEAVPVLRRLRGKWLPAESALADALMNSNNSTEASALIQRLEQTPITTLEGMRLREKLLAHDGKLQEATVVQLKICANPKATVFDWNNLAWLGLFTEMSESKQQAAAARLSQNRDPSILHTLALVQAATGHLNEARSNAYRLADIAADPDQTATVFGRIAEELDLPEVAASYYTRVKKLEPDLTLSNHAFAQMRLNHILGRLTLPARF